MLVLFTLLLLALALAVLFQERLLNAVILLGVFSLMSSAVYFLVGAPDVAVTEGAIGVAFVTFIYVLALSDQGKLHVVAAEVPPFLFQEKGELRGIELEILEGFAEEISLDLEVEFVAPGELTGLIGGRRADLIAGAYFPGFLPYDGLRNTEPFHKAQLAKVVNSRDEGGRTGVLPELDFVVNQEPGDVGLEEEGPFRVGEIRRITMVQELDPDRVVKFDSLEEVVKAYNGGDIGAFVADSGRISNALYRIDAELRDDSEIVAIGEVEYGFAVPAGEEELLEDLNDYLRGLDRSGRIDGLHKKYFR
ncbi:MAG: hydrogenase subunit MbhD domain-containing protein [Candidatus Acetothermia bacterium]